MRAYISVLLSAVLWAALPASVAFSKPDNVDGTNVPEGRIPQDILDNKYPRTYFPGTEKVGPDEMRITALGTGMPNQSPSNAAASFLVELGNGEAFIFDAGTGSTDRLAGLEPDYSKFDKVFISHLHTDHAGDLATLWVAGWINGRHTPLHVYGPSGASPDLGTNFHIDHIRDAWRWDVTSRAGTLPNAGGIIEAHEFDYSKTAVIYDTNGVKITSFPAIHIRDGSVSYRLDWNGLSFVFGGDSYPNRWFAENSKGADVVVHEAFFTPEQWMDIAGFPYNQAYWVTSVIHTPPEGFGKLMSIVEPRLAVAYHYWNHRDIEFEIYEGIRSTYDGPLALADDLTVINLTKDHIEVREAVINHEAWPQGTSIEWDTAPRGEPATGLISDWLDGGKLEGLVPAPKEPFD
ncbi:guanitoxin biosynthesis MBL fold metallo-hydrolase GntH [Parasedimentitalea psychrophila]|uniref:Guanitoxin biosynthesis MBL fold metallo-hydrolase GntH n=1 Tax=Parasedimentitalea psychrophila TaxID=2997337 RepID=A0A9Y2P2G3_9RHOB|nr:guanitoxin biosynthesis MBL fold metallo-hydrolase GntH [Parasedimentitalea psychrophila]WIY25052.1 guanitoxin biosynthesis MBL fold metallo-hydrolase GntH [Parasedimentitalea psychrophila]